MCNANDKSDIVVADDKLLKDQPLQQHASINLSSGEQIYNQNEVCEKYADQVSEQMFQLPGSKVRESKDSQPLVQRLNQRKLEYDLQQKQ